MDGVRSAASVVTGPAGVLGILNHLVIAEDVDAARAAVPALAAADLGGPVTVVTRAGDVLTDFILRGGSGGKQGRIELLAERDTAADRLAEVTTLLDAVRFDLAEHRGVLSAAKEQSKHTLTALREFDSQVAAQAERLNRARVQVEASTAECDRLSAAFALSKGAVTTADPAPARSSTSPPASPCSSNSNPPGNANSRPASSWRPRGNGSAPRSNAPPTWSSRWKPTASPPRPPRAGP
jgi:chromosome segregation protein